MYDKKMWDDDGALIQPPTFRAVADIVLDIVGNVTGHKWIGYIDDALFATLDLTGGYKTPEEVGLELGKKALTSAVSYGASSIGSAASAAASSAISSTAGNVAAQAGISAAQSYATSVATSAINSVNLVNGELKFDGEGFGKTLYSASTIGGALGAGVTAGLNEYSLGTRTVDAVETNGDIVTYKKVKEYTRAQGLNSTQIGNIEKFNSLMGGLSSSAVSFAMDGKATFNILNASDLGIKSNTGLFELTVGKDGISSTIGSGGTNISMGTLIASLDGAKASVKNAQINNAVNKNYKGNMNVAKILRAQYGFGDTVQQAQLDSILKGNTELVFGNTTDGQAQTVDENGKRIVHMNMDQNGDWKMGAIMLGHESYRDGIVSSDDAQLAETRAAVAGHTDMTLRMMGDNLYAASMAQLVGSNRNLQIDLLARSLGTDVFNSYVDGTYDSSADYWKLMEDGSLAYDGKANLYDELGYLIFETESKGMQGSLQEILGIGKTEAYNLMCQAGLIWDDTWVNSSNPTDGSKAIKMNMTTGENGEGKTYKEIYESKQLIDAMTGQEGTIKELNPKTIYNTMVNNGTMDLRPEAKNVPDAVYFAMGSSRYISYEQFKEQNYITGGMPTEGIDYNVADPLNVKDGNYNLITTKFLAEGNLGIHFGVDLSAPENSKVYAMLFNDNTTARFNPNASGKGGNYTGLEMTLSYNFKGQQYSDSIFQRYMHLNSSAVPNGTLINESTNFALSGNTGTKTTAAHLHIDISSAKTSPWLDYMSKTYGYKSYNNYDGREYYAPEMFLNNYKWKNENAKYYN